MALSDQFAPSREPRAHKPSEEFAAYCEAEFERRLNSGKVFDEAPYRRAMNLVVDRLQRMEDEAGR